MTLASSLVRVLARAGEAFTPRMQGKETGYTVLARRVEERAYIGALEARAYVDHRIDALGVTPEETAKHVERRARLATLEAKAYADGAADSLAAAVRAMGRTVAGLSRRVDALERRQTTQRDDVLAARAGALADEVAAFARHLENSAVSAAERRFIGRIDMGLRALADDLTPPPDAAAPPVRTAGQEGPGKCAAQEGHGEGAPQEGEA